MNQTKHMRILLRWGPPPDDGWSDISSSQKIGCVYKRPYPYSEFNNVFGGYEYAFIKTTQPWADHEEAAISWGGHLASVHSLSEHNFIVEQATQTLYLGGQRILSDAGDGSDKAWEWSDGTNWDYTVWNANEPTGSYENSIALWPPKWDAWSDISSSQWHGGVYKRPYP